jgi:hypothetical protein
MIGKIRQRLGDWLEFIDSFRISEKISGIVALLVLVLTLLVAMSIQTVRLQHEYRRMPPRPRRRSTSGASTH